MPAQFEHQMIECDANVRARDPKELDHHLDLVLADMEMHIAFLARSDQAVKLATKYGINRIREPDTKN